MFDWILRIVSFIKSLSEDIQVFLLVWRGMLQREGRGGQFPYPTVFESAGIRTDS